MTTLLAVGLIVAGLYFAREILVPFALAVLLSFMLTPLLRGLHRLRVPRGPAVAVTVLVGFLAVAGFVAVVAGELAGLARQLPVYEANLQSKIGALSAGFPGAGVLRRANDVVRDLRGALARTTVHQAERAQNPEATKPPVPVVIRAPPATPLETVEGLVGPLLAPLATAGLVAVFVIWMLLHREDLRDRVLGLGGGDLHRTTQAMDDAAERVSRYLTRQLTVNAGCALPIGIGLAVIGIPYAALWAAMVLLLRFLPYLGIVIAAAFPLALALALDPGWSLVAWTIALFVVVESVVANLIEPRLYGASTGLSPLAVIAAAVFWTWLWGPVGLLLSTPVTACLVVLGRHIPQLGFLGVLFGSEPALSAEQTFYQRLLAGDPEEACEQAEEFLKQGELAEFFDAVVVPALALAQADCDRGVLPPEKRAMVAAGVRGMLDDLCDEPAQTETSAAVASARAVCVAGRNELDEVAARLLSCLLQDAGCPAPVLPALALGDPGQPWPRLDETGLVCLSLVGSASPARVRYLVRRLRRRAPRAHLMVGLWGEGFDMAAYSADIGPEVVNTLTGSLRDGVNKITAVSSAASRQQFGVS